MQEYQNVQFFFQKAMFEIGLKTFLWLQKILFYGHVISDLKGEKIDGAF